jgi:hypothetical protein
MQHAREKRRHANNKKARKEMCKYEYSIACARKEASRPTHPALKKNQLIYLGRFMCISSHFSLINSRRQ